MALTYTAIEVGTLSALINLSDPAAPVVPPAAFTVALANDPGTLGVDFAVQLPESFPGALDKNFPDPFFDTIEGTALGVGTVVVVEAPWEQAGLVGTISPGASYAAVVARINSAPIAGVVYPRWRVVFTAPAALATLGNSLNILFWYPHSSTR